MRLNSTIDMTWGRLILLSLIVRNDKKTISRHKGCQQMVIEPVHWLQQHSESAFFWDTLYIFGTLSLTEVNLFEEDIWVLKRELGSKARNWKIRQEEGKADKNVKSDLWERKTEVISDCGGGTFREQEEKSQICIKQDLRHQ